jgi:ribonuclease R
MNEKNNPAIPLEGTIKITGKGVGYFNVPGHDIDLEIQPENINTALNGDRVKVELLKHEVYGRKQGKVLEVAERRKTDFVCTLEKASGGYFGIPDDKKMYRDIFIPEEKVGHGNPGDKVFVKLTEWTDGSKSPHGEVIRVIGKKGEHNAEMQSIVYDKGFDIDFPSDVEAEAKAWKEKFLAEDHLENRTDFRDRTTFTIDPVDAKDFDDALSFKDLGNETYEIGIHIADVSHFVIPKTALDKEALKRGTSIYLVDRTIPMLPEILSNDLCSLNPNEDKYAFSAVFEMDKNGKISKRWFGKTLINSDKRFSYEEAQEILDKKDGIFFNELDTLNKISYKLREEKFKNGAIEFESEEVRFDLDNLGKPVKVYKKVRGDTHKMIEDFMLLANREVAKNMSDFTVKNPKAAFVYRIHDAPDREKIITLATFVKALGFELKNNEGQTTAENISKMLKSIEGSPAEMLIKTAAIRSMTKAVYSTSNIGHFGLGFEYYTHFTSPIRRYPDLMVHRLLYRYLTHGKVEQDEIVKYQFLSEESSQREMDAAEAERASIRYKQVEYMETRVGETFDGIISGVSEWGIYVEEKETKADGMIKLRDMTDDHYSLNEKLYAIIGEKTGKKYSLGDAVKVKLVGADPERKTLDFQFI